MADSLSELSGQPPNDPEAQTAINDFSDFTEFFPSDLFRSLTLIGKLDKASQADTSQVHNLTKVYSTLPDLPQSERPDPRQLRQDVSASLDHALRSREGAFAEASRLCNVADNLYARLSGIRAKLSAMPKPPSRDPTPVPRSPVAIRSRRTDHERTPRLKLHMDLDKGLGSGRQTSTAKPKNRQRRMIVPGEIMPPFDPLSPGASIASDSEPEREVSPIRAPAAARPKSVSREKSMPLKIPKLKLVASTSTGQPKTPKVRPQGVMGTNVHSSVAGISVSNAMATLTPPPSSPQPGSQWAPWRELTQWEIYAIRRKMKKNANWQPSDVMVSRELVVHGRGMENYRKAKAAAAAQGEPVLDEPAHESSGEKKKLLAEIASMDPPHDPDASDEDEEADFDEDAELEKKEQWRLQEQQQMEQMSKVINMHHSRVEGLLGPGPLLTPTINGHMQGTMATPESGKKSTKKRKRYPSKSGGKTQSLTNGVDSSAEAQSSAGLQQSAEGDDIESPNVVVPDDSAIDPALMADGLPPTLGDSTMTNGISPEDITAALHDQDQDSAIDPALTTETSPNAKRKHRAGNTAHIYDDQEEGSVDDSPPPAKKIKLVASSTKADSNQQTLRGQSVPLAPPPATAPVGSVIGPGDYSSPKATRSSRRAAQNSDKSTDMPPPPTPTKSATPKNTVQSTDFTKGSTTAKGRKNPSLSIKLPSMINSPAGTTATVSSSVRRNASRNASVASDTSSTLSSAATATPASITLASRRGTRRSDAADTTAAVPNVSKTSTPATSANVVKGRDGNTTTVTKSNSAGPSKITIRGPLSKNTNTQTPRTPRTPLTPWGVAVEKEALPGEERFCSCGAPSYGEMVACDDAACKVEWFHLECVGLEVKPTRRELWYCVGCRTKPGRHVDARGIEV